MNKILGVGILLISSSAFGQIFSVGIRGGVPFTGALSDLTTHGVDVITRSFSDSNQYIVGPMVELHLPLGLSVEADGLYRPLSVSIENQLLPQQTIFRTSTNVGSWEFPILGKFRLPFPVIKPYVDAGPSFRTVGSQLSLLSNKGVTVGLGVELKLSRLRIAPEVRYTHWGSDSVQARINSGTSIISFGNVVPVVSNTNQGEFLLGISF